MIGDLGEYSRVVNEKYKTVVIIERVKEQDLFKLTGYCTVCTLDAWITIQRIKRASLLVQFFHTRKLYTVNS